MTSSRTRVCTIAILVLVSSQLPAQEGVGPAPVPTLVMPAATAKSNVAVRAPNTQYDCGDPSPDEQLVLEYINRARANPIAEGARLGIDITEGLNAMQVTEVMPREPLAMNKILLGTARAHSQDMFTNNYFAHDDLQGNNPFTRLNTAGYMFTFAGENIAVGANNTAASLEDLLMVDAGLVGRGHRVDLLSIFDKSIPDFREIGVGETDGALPNPSGYRNFLTQDFGVSNAGPFVLGVVYHDPKGTGFYDKSQGISGVTVMPDSGTFFAVSSTSGGYAIPVATSGTIMLTISGGPFTTPVTKQVTLSGTNIKIDFTDSGSNVISPGGGTGTSTSPTDLVVSKLQVKLNLVKSAVDSISITGTVPILANQSIAGSLAISVGTIKKTLTLNAKGSTAVGSADSFKLHVKSKKGVVPAQGGKFTARFSKGSFAAALAANGLTGTSASVSIPITLTYVGLTYQVIVNQSYTSNGKSGTTK